MLLLIFSILIISCAEPAQTLSRFLYNTISLNQLLVSFLYVCNISNKICRILAITPWLQVSLLSGDQVQFEWAAGKGDQSLTVETSYRLDDNTWHSVLIEKNRKEAMVVIDGARKGIFPVIKSFKVSKTIYKQNKKLERTK